MKKIDLFIFLLLVSRSISAEEYMYSTVGQPDLFMNFYSNTYIQGDAKAKLESCRYDGISFCIVLNGYYLAVPNNVSKPVRIKLSDNDEFLFLPIKRTLSVLGQKVIGYEASVRDLSNKEKTTVFFNKKQGVMFIRIEGITYWSSSENGIKLEPVN